MELYKAAQRGDWDMADRVLSSGKNVFLMRILVNHSTSSWLLQVR